MCVYLRAGKEPFNLKISFQLSESMPAEYLANTVTVEEPEFLSVVKYWWMEGRATKSFILKKYEMNAKISLTFVVRCCTTDLISPPLHFISAFELVEKKCVQQTPQL